MSQYDHTADVALAAATATPVIVRSSDVARSAASLPV